LQLNSGVVASDRRAFVWRVKDPGGSNTFVDHGSYSLMECRYDPSAADKDTTYANFSLCDQFGNVGLGDLGARSDDPTLGMLHPWGKVTVYGSHSRTYPAMGFFPYNPIATPVTNAFEWDGTNFFQTDKNLLRLKVALMTTNNQVLTAPGTWWTNINIWNGTSLPALSLGSANTSANMTFDEATLVLTNSSPSGQIEMVNIVNGKNMGGYRFDQAGSMNIHATNFVFWNAAGAQTHLMSAAGGNLGVGVAAGSSPKEKLVVSGNEVITNGYFRIWVNGSSPTASNFQAQVYCKTNAATSANEVFVMNSAGTENILTGTVTNQFQGSGTLDFGNTLANTNSVLTITVTGAADGDPVALGVPNASIIGGTCYTAWISSANTVSVSFNNYTTGAKDPASGTFKVLVYKVK
jgi:hypothetical protein